MNLRDQNKQKKHSASAAIHNSRGTGSCAAVRLALLGLILGCLAAVGNVSVSAEAASSNVKKIYMDYLEKVAEEVNRIDSYAIIDLNDDGKKELVYTYCLNLDDSSRICTIKNGKVKVLADFDFRGARLIYTIKGMKSKIAVAAFSGASVNAFSVYNVSADSVQYSTDYLEEFYYEESDYDYHKGSKEISADEYHKFVNKLQLIKTKVYDPELMEGKPSNKAAYTAYRHALGQWNDKVRDPYEEWGLQYALKDINNDGIKELMLMRRDYFQIWTYGSGEPVLYLEINSGDTGDELRTVCYDPDKKTYWVIGIRGLSLDSFKKKGKTVKKIGESYFNWMDEGPYAEKTIGNKTTRISISAYNRKLEQVKKKDSLKLKDISYGDLRNKLGRLSK